MFSTNCCLPPKKKINTRNANTNNEAARQILSRELSRSSKESSDGDGGSVGYDGILFFIWRMLGVNRVSSLFFMFSKKRRYLYLGARNDMPAERCPIPDILCQ